MSIVTQLVCCSFGVLLAAVGGMVCYCFINDSKDFAARVNEWSEHDG